MPVLSFFDLFSTLGPNRASGLPPRVPGPHFDPISIILGRLWVGNSTACSKQRGTLVSFLGELPGMLF